MCEFFQGWRRKTGLALLAMALLLTGAWFRSTTVFDMGSIQVFGLHIDMQSCHGTADVCWPPKMINTNLPEPPFSWHSITIARLLANRCGTSMISDPDGEALLGDGGFKITRGPVIDFGETDDEESTTSGSPPRQYVECQVPYWMLVLPLTLLSAFFLLAKPRPAKSVEKPKLA